MRFWILAGAVALGGCGGEMIPEARPAAYVPVPAAAPTSAPASVVAVKGQTAPRLIAQFGQPALDATEGPARKLQFAGPICVLDTYLYPAGNGRGEPVVTWLDTRQRDGGPIDQASCLAALAARSPAGR
ncbi:hypothetical protein FHS95_001486 [Sphingomonas naasensis]|uniref:Uncharacterized protein n=1 Tax=Sphingomonas naasensis TaxID=1344951 RepID=A0A4S1WAV0_9SPHN|nr:hypothetical protein [Sphingomonas naasensis]NIJ19817.1 hypothetical protein [Sphingomonas naasensis]TGX40051.1 hypothetical protein E5A74_15880 [Sphingomonas naasensis]